MRTAYHPIDQPTTSWAVLPAPARHDRGLTWITQDRSWMATVLLPAHGRGSSTKEPWGLPRVAVLPCPAVAWSIPALVSRRWPCRRRLHLVCPEPPPPEADKNFKGLFL